jgi:hypothetical protein
MKGHELPKIEGVRVIGWFTFKGSSAYSAAARSAVGIAGYQDSGETPTTLRDTTEVLWGTGGTRA